MSRSLVLSFQSASAKYSRLNKKIRKSIARGEFYRYTTRKRRHLLARIEKLRKRLTELRTQIRFATAGLATAALFSATSAEAQIPAGIGSTVGPFEFNVGKNPLPPPPFRIDLSYTEVQYADFDKDGDLDAIVTSGGQAYTDGGNQKRHYYKNVGTKTEARFEFIDYELIFQSSLPGPNYTNNPGHQTYGDLDDDGDLDIIATVSQNSTSGPTPDGVYVYINNPQDGYPYFQNLVLEDGQDNPWQFMVATRAWPSLVDIDKDGDLDVVLAGQYFSDAHSETAFIQVFRNDKVGHAEGVLPTYTRLDGGKNPANPLYFTSEDLNYTGVSFADLDQDGDQDAILTPIYDGVMGTVAYFRNDNGAFNRQEGDWVFNGSSSTGNPFNTVLDAVNYPNNYRSLTFSDIDGDGDADATLGLGSATGSSKIEEWPYRFLENKGNGDFEFSDGAITGYAFNTNSSLTSLFADYNGDGRKDIIVTGTTYDNQICEGKYCNADNYVFEKVFLQQEDGTFAKEPISGSLPEGIPLYGTFIQYVDIDGDNDLDLILLWENDGRSEASVYTNDSGEYTLLENNPLQFINDNIDELSLQKPVFADLNNDGLIDLVLHNRYNVPYLYKNTGTKTNPVFTKEETWDINGGGTWERYYPSIVDMDGDGDYDMIVSKYNYPQSDVWYYQNQGTKEKPDFKLYTQAEYDSETGQPQFPDNWDQNPFAFISDNMGHFDMADVDGDGDMDALLGDYQNGIFSLYENTNPAPNVTITGVKTFQFVANQPITLVTDITISDPDDDNIVRVKAQVTPHKPGTEILTLTGDFNSTIKSTWDDTTGTLTVTGDANPDEWEDVVKGIQYTFTGEATAGGRTSRKKKAEETQQNVTKTITIKALDSDLTESPDNTGVFSVNGDDGGNSAPVIMSPRKTAASGGNIAFYISQIATDLDGEVVVSTADVTSEKGNVSFASDHDLVTIDYSSDKTFRGTDNVTVSVCDNLGACSTQSFTVKIEAEIFIFTGMSPNNDLINDWFQIDFIPENTHVAIYNRWGDLIWEEDNYNVDFPERRFEGKNKNGTEVIAGTYYYKVKYPGGSAKTGYILLNR